MGNFTFSLQRLLNTPLCTTPRHAAMIVAAVRSRFGFSSLSMGGEWPSPVLEVDDLDRMAASGRQIGAQSVQRRNRRVKIFEEAGPVAIVPVHGTLTKSQEAMDPESGMTGYNRIEQKLDAAMADESIKGIWLDVDSGGGEAGGMLSLARFIRDRCSVKGLGSGGKPVWGMASPYAYSAAYGLLSACDYSIASLDGGVGSVGVLCLHADYTQFLEDEGIKITVLRSGARKARGNPYEALDDETRAHIQGQMDELYDLFTDMVGEFRGIAQKKVRETEGLDYMPEAARAIGFVNEVSTEHQAFEKFLRKFR